MSKIKCCNKLQYVPVESNQSQKAVVTSFNLQPPGMVCTTILQGWQYNQQLKIQFDVSIYLIEVRYPQYFRFICAAKFFEMASS